MTARTYEYESEFVRRYVFQGRAEGRAEGEAAGEANALLTVLAARGLEVTDEAQTRITERTDRDQLSRWLHRAATADSIDEIFA